MSQTFRNLGKRYDGPLLKIKQRKLLNLPQIRKQEEEFQSLIDSFESDQSLSFQDSLVKIPLKQTQQDEPEQFALYGLQRIKTDRYFLCTRKNSNRSLLNKSNLDESVDKKSLDWLEHCKRLDPPQARVQFYDKQSKYDAPFIRSSYKWEDVEVLDFNSASQRYLVQQFPDGPLKKVSRMQIKFYSENPTHSLERRKSINCKLRTITKKPSKACYDEETRNTMPQFLNLPLQQRFSNQKKQTIVSQLLDEVAKQYERDMEKCKSFATMKKYKQKAQTFVREVRFEKLQRQIQKSSLFANKSMYRALHNLIERCENFKVGLLKVASLERPIEFERLQAHLKEEARILDIELMKHRHYIISELQDFLPQHNFNLTYQDDYENSPLQKIITRMDFQYSEFLYGLLLTEYSDFNFFLKSFLPSTTDQGLSRESLVMIKGLPKQPSKDKNYVITIHPSLPEIRDCLMKVNLIVKDCVMKQRKMESQLVPLALVKEKGSFNMIYEDRLLTILRQSEDIIANQFDLCKQQICKFDHFEGLLQPLKKRHLQQIFGITSFSKPLISSLNCQTITSHLMNLKKVKTQISKTTLDFINLGLFTLDLKPLKVFLQEKATENLNLILKILIDIIRANISNLSAQYQEMYNQSSTVPNKEEDLIQLKLFLDQLQIIFAKQNLEISQIQQYFDLLEDLFYSYDISLYEDYLQLLFWPFEITEAFQINKKAIQIQERAFLIKLEQEKQEFSKLSEQIQDLFTKVRKYHVYENSIEQVGEVFYLKDLIDQAKMTINSFNQREVMFSLPFSQFSELELLYKEFKPYSNLWDLIAKFHRERDHWLYSSFKKLNHAAIHARLQQFINETMSVTQYFKEIKEDGAQSLTRGFRRSIEEFKDILWIVEALGIEAFQKKPALWRDLFRDCKIQNFDPKEDFPLNALLQRGILNVKDDVLALSHRAEKGWNIEKRLQEMQYKLSEVMIEVNPYSGTFILKNYEEVQTLLDEQLNVLTMLKAQPHIKMVLGKANQLEYKIVLIEDTLEYAMKCQKHWMYLDPIFENEDIKKKLSKETLQYKSVDSTYRVCMKQFNENRMLWDCIENEKMKIEFSSAVLMLDQIQKSLNKYLEQKRSLFPRFYFLSDEELVEILAQTKDPSKLQRHIFKCFEGIHELGFADYHVITSLHSIQHEKIQLDHPIDVRTGVRQGNVEQWLSDLQIQMQLTIKQCALKTLKDLNSSKFEFITKWPTQTILLSNQIRWTRNAESAIRQQQKMTLKTFFEQLSSELQETVNLVRTEERAIQRTTLEAMVVMEVHAKDIIASLNRSDTQSIHDFAWISQLRYYNTEQGEVKIRMVNACVNYGFEYLGRVTRLIITSLTDRCQRTLLGALHLNYGGAPEGPAGTGKSETVKDLAKAVAMPCIVFNCSDGLNYIAMGKFFKGLASSGAWCCFDEFNRIDPEVLSVVAQQIFTIQKAIKEERTKFVLDGQEISLVPTCAINVTMNPGYAGRSELPDNLKILFRPCAMMVPDYAMIAEIHLYSIGFEKARELSSKIVACLKLCNEQLSSQEHYDFGMRALKAILNTAKHLYDGTEEVICLTSIIRVNQPKFTEDDNQLFLAITGDLFPGVQPLSQEDLDLEDACQELNFQMDNSFLQKCDHLINNINVRNGVMCIGKPFSGKSATVHALSMAKGAQIFRLNPKAVTTDQLYGKLDPDTKQWSEGVASILIRDNLQKLAPIWIQFDGPVDSLWIENLNTVLDDNKKLCLTSGEILKIPQTMCMIFEVENLISASPATISRCGMVYFQPINWYLQVLSIKMPQGFDQDYFVRRLRFLIDSSLAWVMEYSQFVLEDFENVAVAGMIRLLCKLLLNLNPEEKHQEIWDNLIIFSLIWSLGAALEERYRVHFNDYLHRLLRTKKSGLKTQHPDDLEISLPQNEDVDYFQCVYLNSSWVKWSSLTPDLLITPELKFHQIIVPTPESIRNDHLCQLGLHTLFFGPSGTGKSLSMAKFQKFQINCSGQTTANSIQRLIETKINKRRRKGYYGAEEGHIVIFIDDMNLPQKESNGSQSAIELLRQWMEQGGWFDLETKEFKNMCDITFLGAMQFAIADGLPITLRYLRHFNNIYIDGFDNESISNMLKVFADWVFVKLNTEMSELKKSIVNGTIQMFERVQTALLPTPAKSHYVYNIKDLFRIFEGVNFAKSVQSQYTLVKLWAHECLRVFSDRLIDEYDIRVFEKILREQVIQTGYSVHDFSHLLWTQLGSKQYEESNELGHLKLRLQNAVEEFNLQNQSRMNIIFFQHAIMHVARIARVLQARFGHMLLIGMSGCGRSSLSRVANFTVHGQPPLVIDARNWDDQLLAILKDIGLDNQQQTILFLDTQLISEYMLEDICNIMSHGEVPHLFPPEERMKIQEDTPFPKFIQNCKANTNVILCMQTVGSQFRKRLRTFPKLLSCSTIDYFASWPDEALEQTAQQFLPRSVIKIAINIHHKIVDINERYQQELRRHFYVTPSQYLQMLQTYTTIFQQKNNYGRVYIDKFETGVEKIDQTEENIQRIRKVLFELKPKLEKATQENQELLRVIKKNQKEADQTKLICEEEEKLCNIKREEANNLRNLCQTQLDAVLPLLGQATDALEKITREDMILLKSFMNPPASAAIVMEGLCYAFQEDDKVKPKQGPPLTTTDFWDYAKRYLLNDKLIKRIKKMKIEEIRAINPANIVKLQIFSQNPLFERDKVFNASSAAGNLADWIRAVLATYEAVEIIEPKKLELKIAEERLKDAEELVRIKRAALEAAYAVLKELSAQYEKARKEKAEIEKEIGRIESQLQRAEKLIFGLGEERERWKRKAANFKSEQDNLLGDCLLGAGIIAYLGVFPVQYRELCLMEWKKRLRLSSISFSENYQIQQQLSDQITINKWLQQKLPNDEFSIDNAIILKQSNRWPLMIDPQIQANYWIKNMEDAKTLLVLNATQAASSMQLPLEHALQIGYAVLLENVGQNVDALFEPILQFRSISAPTKGQIKFGEKLLELSPDFRFYMTTKLGNPHYPPQICLMVTMLNFQVTLEGLTDQMLNIVVKMDEPMKEEQRLKNIQLYFLNKHRQQDTENQILKLLSESVGDLLEDEKLIDTLQKSKEEGQEIEDTLKKLQYDQQMFSRIRDFYSHAANSVASLYFVLNDLSLVEPTYQWSLDFYIQLYQKSIKEASYGRQKRIQNIIDKFTYNLYVSINRSLLEKDKLIFRFLLCLRVMHVPPIQIRACVMGPTITDALTAAPKELPWLDTRMWLGIVDLQLKFPSIYDWLPADFQQNPAFWEAFYHSPASYRIQIRSLSQFHINMIVKILKPEQFVAATNHMILECLGKMFLENLPSTFEAFYQESSQYAPLLCIVTPGADPRQDITNLAEKYNMGDKYSQLSLGQGQVQAAVKLIRASMQHGRWVLLQNCHVASSFMPELEQIYETLNKRDLHKDFRLWLTTLPTNILPNNVILRSIKMTYELPRGLKNNMLRSYYQQDTENFENSKKVVQWKNIFYSLTLFHACILERRKFGALGWNIPYNFSQHDLEISKEQLRFLLDTQPIIQWDALNYLISETNYGGRVTDPEDRKLLNVILADFLNPKVLQEQFQFHPNYSIPPTTNLKGYIDHIQTLPITDPPSLFGLHQNAEIYSSILETKQLSTVVLQLLPRSVGLSTQNPERVIKQKCHEILLKLPSQFEVAKINKKYPLFSANSLNTVLNQEIARYNKLLGIVEQSLNTLIKGLDGHAHISDESYQIQNELIDNVVPEVWKRFSYPSNKMLGTWIIDLLDRLAYINGWIEHGQPDCYWLGGFFFIQGFLTGQLQNYSRQQKIAIDQFSFDYLFHQQLPRRVQGFLVRGIYIDGARFDFETNSLEDAEPNQLYYEAPVIEFIPTVHAPTKRMLDCPLYNTPIRRGSLTTTGFSINFIKHIGVPVRQEVEFWVKRGVALILQID